MNFNEIANKYFQAGLSVIPCNEKKIPVGKWKGNQTELMKPTGVEDTYGIGIVCGKVSGNLELLDFDTKYDVTGTLFKDYSQLVKEQAPDLLKRLVVEKSVSGGYHFFYRCNIEINGNTKLAKRETTDKEREKTYHETYDRLLKENKKNDEAIKGAEKAKKNDSARVLIETRGEGGYVMVAPSPKYKVLQGDICDIPTITPEERNILLDTARIFNAEKIIESPKYENKEYSYSGLSPFEDYNNRGDTLQFLKDNGWRVTLHKGSKNLLLRPGGTGSWSADYDTERKIFYVWTDSSDFEKEKGYNQSQVLTTIQFNGDYGAASKWLLKNGYGSIEKKKDIKAVIKHQHQEITEETEIDEFIATDDELDTYITQIRNGTFVMGKTTGIPSLDKHWLFKEAHLVIWLGFDNVGKSICVWFLATLSAVLHGWKWIIYSSENKGGGIKRKIIEYYTCKNIKDLTEEELKEANQWFKKHFTIINNNRLYTYKELLEIGTKLCKKEPKNGFMIDPYNSLYKDTQQEHQYDYVALSEMRVWNSENQCSIYLNIHAVTEALRRKHPKGHTLEGYPMPPHKADAEGGGKYTSKADDFITLHRYVQHPDIWNTMEFHVHKIKEMESGGKTTYLDEPVKLRMIPNTVGYVDEFGVNPIEKHRFQREIQHIEVPYESTPISPNAAAMIAPNPRQEDDTKIPF